jgi:hypothetical protein
MILSGASCSAMAAPTEAASLSATSTVPESSLATPVSGPANSSFLIQEYCTLISPYDASASSPPAGGRFLAGAGGEEEGGRGDRRE